MLNDSLSFCKMTIQRYSEIKWIQGRLNGRYCKEYRESVIMGRQMRRELPEIAEFLIQIPVFFNTISRILIFKRRNVELSTIIN